MLGGDVKVNSRTGQGLTRAFPPHYMLYAPGLTNADIGTTEAAFEANKALPIVYNGYSGGSRTAYIIIIAGDGQGHDGH